ncbi:hypothetical protein [Marinobacter sp. ANT_B65]|uniref:hypothetical protein n=1 Tax=Marinobacter sp. ANT_B65 TaxID=2039467 RepID=UPI000BBE3144|nr:hypothetical protein [Marinobacter sp. ANT_B65]PCM43485.1 hypothetical protein CPA50_13970 [Marinobacter sp. ANT_B65]
MSKPDENIESIEQAVTLLEEDLKIEPGFLIKLNDEDDWSFVIKSHAFLEAALSHLISEALSEAALHDVFANIETSNNKSGKLAFIKALDLLDDEARRFIRALSELRNSLVHDIGQVGFSFEDYVASLEKQQKANFVRSFGYFANGENFELGGQSVSTKEFMLKSPKRGTWFSVMALCSVIYLAKGNVKVRKILASLQVDIEAGPNLDT